MDEDRFDCIDLKERILVIKGFKSTFQILKITGNYFILHEGTYFRKPR